MIRAFYFERYHGGGIWKPEVSLEDPRRSIEWDSLRNVRPMVTIDGGEHRHLKRGSEYVMIGQGSLQNAREVILKEGDSMSVYLDDDGDLWVRATEEFNDGRFETIKKED